MSREERNSKSFKYTTTSNESVSRKDYIPTKTTKSMTTESYDYLNQQSLSKNNITERPYYTLNQQSYSRYSSNRPNKQNLNSKFIAKKRIIKGNAKFSQGNSNLSGEKCTCDHPNENVQKKIFKCKLCGTIKSVSGKFLRNGNTKSCGCLQPEKARQNGEKCKKDLTGQRFGLLTVLERMERKSGRNAIWRC